MAAAIVFVVIRRTVVLPDLTDAFDVEDALHRLAVCRDGDEVVSLSDGGTVASAAESSAATTTSASPSSTAATESAGRARRCFGRTEIDLTSNSAPTESAASTAGTTLTSPTDPSAHSFPQRAHSRSVATRTHRGHAVAHCAHGGRIHSGGRSPSRYRGVATCGAE